MKVATKWEEITLKQYESLMNFIEENNTGMSDLDRSIEIYALLSDNPDKTRETLLNMPIDKLSSELNKIQFIVKKYEPKIPDTEYTIDGEKYTVQLNLRQMTTAQYIDFQNFYKDYKSNFKYIFMCFLIPKGKKYNEGYDVIELAEKLYNKIPINIVNDIMVFFCRLLKALTESTLIYSIRQMIKVMKKEKDPVKNYKIRKMIVQARQTLRLVQNETEFAGLTE